MSSCECRCVYACDLFQPEVFYVLYLDGRCLEYTCVCVFYFLPKMCMSIVCVCVSVCARLKGGICKLLSIFCSFLKVSHLFRLGLYFLPTSTF